MTKSTLLVPTRTDRPGDPADACVPVEVRRIAHARRVRLSFRPERGFLLTCPPQVPASLIHEVLERAEGWARKVLARRGSEGLPILPEELHLTALGESLRVDYQARRNQLCRGWLRIDARGESERAFRLLRSQLRALAEERFMQRTGVLAKQHGLTVSAVRCGLQRTRWGSCSAHGSIRLNSVMLFIAPALADHVMLHELAHLRHMNHSAGFRALLARMDPEHETHERELQNAWRQLPAWWWQGGALPDRISAAADPG
jgi:predicted metal-dependent hydrolase